MAKGLAILNADVWTLDDELGRAESILAVGERIVAVGSERRILQKARSQGVPTRDANGLTVLPGLIDSHCHLVHQGLLAERVDLSNTRSKEEALDMVREALKRHRGPTPLLAERWDESHWKEKRYPSRGDLDDISSRRPIILRRIDGHIAVANRAACRALRARLPGVDEEAGLLIEEASLKLNEVYPASPAQTARAIDRAQRRALRLGLTGVHEFVTPLYFRGYVEALRRARLLLRVRASLYTGSGKAGSSEFVGFSQGSGRLERGGVKAFADGSIGGHTAALTKSYADQPGGKGRLNWSNSALRALVRSSAVRGLQPSVHAIGDAAIDQVLDAYERLPAGRRKALRPRVEHFEVHTDDQVERARRLGVVLSMQPNFVGEWSLPGGMYERRFGDERRYRNNQFRRILAGGGHLAFGSDGMPLDPWYGIDCCVQAPHRDQRLPLEAALRAYSSGSAYGIGWELDSGTLTPGKRADLLLVQADWRGRNGVRRAKVHATMIGGRWVYRRRRGPV